VNTQPELIESAVTHTLLIAEAAKWLARQGCSIVITDMAHSGPETADAIGWRGGASTLIECKVSLTDFRADASKPFRRDATRGMGVHRYYCAPHGLLTADMMPPEWGLLELAAGRMLVTKKAGRHRHEVGAREEIRLLMSAIRRIGREAPTGMSVKFYTIEPKCRATLGVEVAS